MYTATDDHYSVKKKNCNKKYLAIRTLNTPRLRFPCLLEDAVYKRDFQPQHASQPGAPRFYPGQVTPAPWGGPEKQAAILQRKLSSACSSTQPARIQSSSLGSNHSSVRSHSGM